MNMVSGKTEQSSLDLAAGNGFQSTMSNLLDKGADVHHRDGNSRTALDWAILGKHNEIAIILMAYRDVEVDDQDCLGRTPLIWTAINGDDAMLRKVLERRVNVDVQDLQGRSALSLAAGNGCVEIVRTLVDHGANIGLRDAWGQTAWSVADILGHEEVADLVLDMRQQREEAEDTPGPSVEIVITIIDDDEFPL